MSEISESDSEYNSSDEEVSITISVCAYRRFRANSNLTSFTCPAAGGLGEGIAEAGVERCDRDEQAAQKLCRE